MSEKIRTDFEAWARSKGGGAFGVLWDEQKAAYSLAVIQALYEAWLSSRRQALEEAAAGLDALAKPGALKLMAGEMTAGELRTAQAVLRAAGAAIRREAEGK